MKHIKRVKSSVVTLLLGQNKIHRIPVLAIFLRPPVGMAVSEWDDKGNGDIPRYGITDLIPLDDDPENAMVGLVFQERLENESAELDSANEYAITVPIHTVALAQSLSLVNETFNIAIFNSAVTKEDGKNAVSVKEVIGLINFPETDTEEYQDILDKLSTMVDGKFVEPLYSDTEQGNDYGAIPTPLRRSHMAIMPLISALSQDDVKTLLQVMALESTLDNFHLRNHNQNPEITQGEYAKVIETMKDQENYVVPEIPEDIRYMASFDYSILENMTDAIEDHLKIQEPNVRDRMYYKDITLLILLTNVKAIYEKSETDDFIVNSTVTNEEGDEEYNFELHQHFMHLANTELGDTFKDVNTDEIQRTEFEKKRLADLELWNKTPDEYWPDSLPKLKEFVQDHEKSAVYFDIMNRSYETPEEFQALVSDYGLGKVFTSMILKTALNLAKFTTITSDDEGSAPSSLIATQWISPPEDTYMWEFPALSYDLSNYDISTFMSLLTYIRNDFAAYLSIALQGVVSHLIEEKWDSTNLEWNLSEHTGMPEKYQKSLVALVSEIENIEIDPQEIEASNITSQEELNAFLAHQVLHNFVVETPQSIEDSAKMIAYAFPALADIHVQNIISTSEDGDPEPLTMGSTEWKRHRVMYIENMLNSIVHNVERKTI